ncbi:RNA dependent RNA polymerase-domain-containing protein [Dichotomopilus funicola]|uniref:RNA dependent RNA polymerase-domain-containing protein n=1 Tax=Dichotomopilus funicola TaxID=1934379 RepID=A0AAN6V771_9PEZI|nr:RNA dependent RNA polymerase-domain-containing protein [Dichotomopilus funicola]
MENPTNGSFQHLLVKGAQNGRVQAQHRRGAATPFPRNDTPHWRQNEPASLGRGPGRSPRPTAQVLRSLLPPTRPQSRQRSPQAMQPATVFPQGWASSKSATMVIRPIPENATPWDIQQFFSRFGNVAFVEVSSTATNPHRAAKIRFEPPPTDLSFFHQGKCRLYINGSVTWVAVEFTKNSLQQPTWTTVSGNVCPVSLDLKPEKLTFGILTNPTNFMPKKDLINLKGSLEMKLTADFRRMKLFIHFPLFVNNQQQYYRFDIKFGIIRGIYEAATRQGTLAVVLSLADPPVVWKKQRNSNKDAWDGRSVWDEEELWYRAVEIKPDSQRPLAEPVSLDEKPKVIDLGHWTTYWMEFTKSSEDAWTTIKTHLRDWNVNTEAGTKVKRIEARDPELWGLLADPDYTTLNAQSPWDSHLALLSTATNVSLPYEVRYQLEVCVSRGIISEYAIGREFLEKLAELSTPDGLGLNRARLLLEYAADEGKPIYDPLKLLTDRDALTYCPTTLHIPDYCALIRKVTITPTRIIFSTPTVETTNRVVRQYHRVRDYFIRVQFIDEVMDGRIRASDADRDDELYARVCRVMTQGIRMGKWHWKFLAFGNSQIRESGAFFFCEPEDRLITCGSIRQWMGNFDHISSVAKLAARLGQCFSTTRLLRSISSPMIVKISDIETDDGFCFTDGVGKISPPLAGLISEAWKLDRPPSAFQFRMGGCKGVLVDWPDAKGLEVHVRPSQEKFSAVYNGLEIIRCSQFTCPTLNRQIILILSCLGVPDEVFTDMMAAQIADYDIARTDMSKAVELLSTHVDENMTTTTIATMVLNGFMDTEEPFVKTLLQLWRSWSIKGLKEKAKLHVEQGAFVLGCADETGALRGHSRAIEGRGNVPRNCLPQIFIQVPDPEDRGTYKVITGICIVGRNPSLHPGDIRVVEAVDVPHLRHLRDVVVFPLKGDRDVPSMCSGGDLDGDDFFVIWDPKLLPREWGHPPMNYSAPEPLTESKTSIAKSLAFFFVLFMKNDRLPLIAHAHLATADFEPEGAKHPKCLELANLHSTAVDYVKTGIPAEWNKKLAPRKYPHFMEKHKNMSYHSMGVLGKLYDMIDKDVFDNRDNYKLRFDDRILKRYHLSNALLKAARKIKTQYDISIRRIMGQLEIRTEFEVWTTFVLTKPRIGSDYKVQEKVGREAAGLKAQFRGTCLKAVEEHGFNKLEFVAAMYTVTWEETRIALHEARQPHVLPDGTIGRRRITARSMPLLSFPWLFPDDLGKIALNTEKLPDLKDLGVSLPSAGSKVSGADIAKAEREFGIEGMEYTKTSDGRFIHRGEVLHLFRHQDDGDDQEFFFEDDEPDLTPPELNDSEAMPESPQETPKGDDGFPDLLDLDFTPFIDFKPITPTISPPFGEVLSPKHIASPEVSPFGAVLSPKLVQEKVTEPSKPGSIIQNSAGSSPTADTSLLSFEDMESSSIEYIPMPAHGSAGWGLGPGFNGARLTAAELWGHDNSYPNGDLSSNGGTNQVMGGVESHLNGAKKVPQEEKDGRAPRQDKNSHLNGLNNPFTSPNDILGNGGQTGEQKAGDSKEESDSDGEIVYEEDIIEIAAETMLEKAARFA